MTDKPDAERKGCSAGGARSRARARLPGDPRPETSIARMIRVDQAGEYGARRIYEGQLAVLGPRHPETPTIRKMYEQELRHLETFDALMSERRVRPTALQPLWHLTGFALGATTAMMGARAAMACTVAVEEVIDEHYAKQAEALGDEEADLRTTIEEFRADEQEHRDVGLAHGAEQTPGYALLTAGVKAGSRLAIWLSKRL